MVQEYFRKKKVGGGGLDFEIIVSDEILECMVAYSFMILLIAFDCDKDFSLLNICAQEFSDKSAT